MWSTGREADLTDADLYLCGPPPMVDAAIPLLESRRVPTERIYFDKFTTSVAAYRAAAPLSANRRE